MPLHGIRHLTDIPQSFSARQIASRLLQVAPRPGHDIGSLPTRVLQRFCPLVERCRSTVAFDPTIFVVPSLCHQFARRVTSPVIKSPL